MYRLLVMYHQPADTAAFDKHYYNVHLPLAAKIPNTRTLSVSKTGLDKLTNNDNYYLIAQMEWDSKEAMTKALQTPEGIASHDDFVSFAGDRVTMIGYEVSAVDPRSGK